MKEELEKLQDQFAFIDLLSKSGKSGMIEILLKVFLPMEFRMEPDHHGAPHIHIKYEKINHAASYRINDGVRVAGNLDNKYDKIVEKWIFDNQAKLLQIWDEMKAGNQKKYELLIGQLL